MGFAVDLFHPLEEEHDRNFAYLQILAENVFRDCGRYGLARGVLCPSLQEVQ